MPDSFRDPPEPWEGGIRAAAAVDCIPLPRSELNVIQRQRLSGDRDRQLVTHPHFDVLPPQRPPAVAGGCRIHRQPHLGVANLQGKLALPCLLVKVPQLHVEASVPRREWLSDLKDMAAESDYAEVNDSVAYTMVRPEWVVEISCLDLINQNTRGGSIDRMVLGYDMPKNMYQSIRRLPLASPISPNFIRRREDKSIRRDDLRLNQLADVIEVPMMDRDARQLSLPRSEVLVREVFTKTLKGNQMVRKLLLWKTNKESEGGNFPAYVAYFTDFSPNRATPIDRDIRISNSREQIEQLFAAMKAEYIVKGWAPAT